MSPTISDRPLQTFLQRWRCDLGPMCTHCLHSVQLHQPFHAGLKRPQGQHTENKTLRSPKGGLSWGCQPSLLPRQQHGPSNTFWAASGFAGLYDFILAPWAIAMALGFVSMLFITGTTDWGLQLFSVSSSQRMRLVAGLASQPLP